MRTSVTKGQTYFQVVSDAKINGTSFSRVIVFPVTTTSSARCDFNRGHTCSAFQSALLQIRGSSHACIYSSTHGNNRVPITSASDSILQLHGLARITCLLQGSDDVSILVELSQASCQG
ncbi:hypothetical protein J6590_098597 [Homalodisca vitripennis]|nr:hypothetical protein J6590_098597 [Homalodisca vitripennis]